MSSGPRPLHIYKFGGTSVETSDRMRDVARLIGAAATDARLVVVVSALGGVTDQLEKALVGATNRSSEGDTHVRQLRERHRAMVVELASSEIQDGLNEKLDAIWDDLEERLQGISLLRECTPRTRDAVMGTGELASAPVLTAALKKIGVAVGLVDSRAVIRTDDAFGEANIDFEATKEQAVALLEKHGDDDVIVLPGFIGATADGTTTTLGRSGSDYTATILAAALGAERVVIWTDVDGVMSADPRLVPAAFTLGELSYQEAAEMAWFGAKVLHPRTMRPIRTAGIPLVIKNTMNPDAAGTVISSMSSDTVEHVKAVTSVPDFSLVMIEGSGMMGIPGIAARTFRALAAGSINVLLISQASSEQSICIGIRSVDAERAHLALRHTFDRELASGDISRVHVVASCSVVSLVGDQMRLKPGLAGRMFSTLGRANINVLAIAQGAAETNISAVVAAADTERAVRALHEAFARSFERLHLFVVGPGAVGRKLLELLDENAEALSRDYHINLRLVGLANSSRMFFDPDGVAFSGALAKLTDHGEPASLDHLLKTVCDSHLERMVFVDTTASGDVADRYPELLQSGIGVVTPNKRANTRDQAFYDSLRRVGKERNVPFLYESTVGAALPVIQTLRNLVRSGDRVHRLQGILSGTLAFVFNEMRKGKSFSESVQEAHRRGFTEPDPREDLSGEDVARKLLTLAREAGFRLEREDIVVESLVSPDAASLSVDAFMEALRDQDAAWAARTQDGAIQYVATLDEKGCRVAIEHVEDDSPFANLDGTDNMVVFETDWYVERPLIIQGAGAGPLLTASGILSDILIAAERMR